MGDPFSKVVGGPLYWRMVIQGADVESIPAPAPPVDNGLQCGDLGGLVGNEHVTVINIVIGAVTIAGSIDGDLTPDD